MLTPKICLAMLLYVAGHTLAWFQLNSQFVWEWWRNHPFLTVLIYSVPMGLCFLVGTRFAVEETGALWSSRFMAFSASYFIFPVLTWHFMHESMFTAKTLTCIFLSCMILGIQLFWK